MARAYTVGTKKKKAYAGNLPYCNKCKMHHSGQCNVKCGNYKRVGHMTKYWKASVAVANQRALVANQKTITCYECGRQGHYRSECPKLKGQNHDNLLGLLLARQVEFQIDLVPNVAPVARAPYTLALSCRILSTVYRGFSKITKPITKLTQKSVKFDWGEKKEAAFQLLKQNMCSAPIMSLPEGPEDFVVYCDASHKGLGAVLMQKEKVIAYASRQLNIHEKNYVTHNLELVAVKELNMKQHRWFELLSDYDCKIRYHPRKILNAQAELMKEENVKEKNLYGMNKEFDTCADGTLFIKKQSWVPRFDRLKDLIMNKSHKSKYSFHHGSDKMYHDLKKLCRWPNIKAEIATYVLGEKITTDFVTKLPKTSSGHDTIWVIVDHVTKSAHLLPMREIDSMEKVNEIVLKEKALEDMLKKEHEEQEETLKTFEAILETAKEGGIILNAQAEEMKEENVKEENLGGMNKEFETRADGTLCIEKRR
ncbi:putative reverse transcriptase domain-containing protein [Tanacetum coccineum]